MSRQKTSDGVDGSAPPTQNDGSTNQPSPEQYADTQHRATGYRLPAPGYSHEDLAWFTRTAADLAALEAEARARADGRGPHGRRFARLRTVIEDALLQTRQGIHEARHGQVSD